MVYICRNAGCENFNKKLTSDDMLTLHGIRVCAACWSQPEVTDNVTSTSGAPSSGTQNLGQSSSVSNIPAEHLGEEAVALPLSPQKKVEDPFLIDNISPWSETLMRQPPSWSDNTAEGIGDKVVSPTPSPTTQPRPELKISPPPTTPQTTLDAEFVITGAGQFPEITVFQGGKQRGPIYTMQGDQFFIGRSGSSNPMLPDLDLRGFTDEQKVSHRHARIIQINGDYLVEDLGSRSGTWVNGTFIYPGELHPLQSGDVIQIGEAADLEFFIP